MSEELRSQKILEASMLPRDTSIPGPEPIIYEDGKFLMPPGFTEVQPQFPVGDEVWQKNLFIEYERTFGRGEAKYLTHGGLQSVPGTEHHKRLFEKYGEDVLEKYREFKNKIYLMSNGSQVECEAMIQELQEYRKNHPNLYTDVKDPNEPKKKFEIKIDE